MTFSLTSSELPRSGKGTVSADIPLETALSAAKTSAKNETPRERRLLQYLTAWCPLSYALPYIRWHCWWSCPNPSVPPLKKENKTIFGENPVLDCFVLSGTPVIRAFRSNLLCAICKWWSLWQTRCWHQCQRPFVFGAGSRNRAVRQRSILYVCLIYIFVIWAILATHRTHCVFPPRNLHHYFILIKMSGSLIWVNGIPVHSCYLVKILTRTFTPD